MWPASFCEATLLSTKLLEYLVGQFWKLLHVSTICQYIAWTPELVSRMQTYRYKTIQIASNSRSLHKRTCVCQNEEREWPSWSDYLVFSDEWISSPRVLWISCRACPVTLLQFADACWFVCTGLAGCTWAHVFRDLWPNKWRPAVRNILKNTSSSIIILRNGSCEVRPLSFGLWLQEYPVVVSDVSTMPWISSAFSRVIVSNNLPFFHFAPEVPVSTLRPDRMTLP